MQYRIINKTKMKNVYLAIIILGVLAMGFTDAQNKNVTYLNNSSLFTIKKGYPGNKLVNDRFVNEEEGFNFSLSRIIKWKVSGNPQQAEKNNDQFKLKVIKNQNIFNSTDDMIVWLGNASFFIRIGGKTILTDPCLTHPPLVKRQAGLPFEIEDIRNIDYLLISHNHMDHLDSDTLKRLNLKNTLALLPLRVGRIVKAFNKNVKIQEAGWFQKFDTNDDEIEIYFMPAKHFSNRSLWDHNESLWGSYIIKTKGICIFFAGDTAYSASQFEEINKYFPDIDICLMPAGAYAPRYFMKDVHVTPEEAVDAFNILQGKYFIPMHYGTFDTTDEPRGEPLRILLDLEKKKKINGRLKILDIGEIFKI